MYALNLRTALHWYSWKILTFRGKWKNYINQLQGLILEIWNLQIACCFVSLSPYMCVSRHTSLCSFLVYSQIRIGKIIANKNLISSLNERSWLVRTPCVFAYLSWIRKLNVLREQEQKPQKQQNLNAQCSSLCQMWPIVVHQWTGCIRYRFFVSTIVPIVSFQEAKMKNGNTSILIRP